MSYSPTEIADLRRRLNITQDELAAELGVHRSNISKWEAGVTQPRGPAVRLLHQLAERQRRASKEEAVA